ncbi:cilia- and flagella-associated protein 141 [Mixophyes fleayi]|uniref:cilia- and flagella-associated protein 141 n=1 Tax=Mixophyes fleayi TaxID=3061075 RepID=UPI003F4D913B
MLASRVLQNTKSITQREDLLQLAEMERQRERGVSILNAWKEDAGGSISARIQRHRGAQMRQELRMANKELVLVRRAALQRLLQEEQRQYQEELNRLGRAFYVQKM